MFKKMISLFLSLSLIITQPIFAQGVAQLNLAQYLGQMRPVATDSFRPTQLRYFSYDNLNNSFRILLDKGDTKDIKDNQLKQEAKELMDYFLIGVTLPNDVFWVNLRPDSPDNIIDPELEKTGLGKILLEADLQLKKDTASLTSPQTPEGKAYWDKLYKKAGELFGSENITIPTITRPWIVPGEIIVRESGNSAYIYKATLKVLLEQDHLKDSSVYNFSDPRLKELNEYSSQLIRESIIPKLTQEVNSSKRYAQLRQVYYSLVLSRWFKMRFAGKSGQYVDLIDKHDLTNLTAQESYDKRTYFKQYQESFAQGEYNLKEPVYTPYGQSIRSYMSGGFDGSGITKAISGANARVVGSPVEQQLLNKKNIVVLDNNFKIVNLKQPLTLAASPMMGEKFINSDDVFLNKLRYVLYGEQSDIVRANLWNNFQTAFPGVEDEPGYSWGFAVELNENRGVGSVVGGVRYKDSIILNIYVLNKYSDDSNLSAEKREAILGTLKTKVIGEMTAVASPLTVPEANKIIGRFYKGKEAAYPEYTNIFWYDIPALLAVAKKAVELMRQDSKRVFNDEVNTPASARPDTLDLEKMREIESFLEETLDNREKRKQLKNIREKINTFLNVEIIILIKNYLKFINSDRYKDIRDYARKNDIVRTSKAIKEFYATLAGDTFVKSSVDPAIAGKVQEWQDIENTARKISASSALSVPHDSHLKRYFASPMTAPEIKAKLLNIVAVGGYTFNPDLENGEFSQPHQSYSSRIAPLEEIPDLFDLAVKLLQEQSSDQNLKALVRQICRQEIGGLLQAAIKSNIKVEIEDIEEYVRKEEISQAADELSQIFNKTRGYYDEANYCNKISDAWRVASTASPLAGTKLKDAGSVDFIKGGIDFTDKAMRIGLERVGSFAGLKLVLPEISNVAAIDLDNEFKQIQIMATSGIRPSDNRILEFAAACYYRGEFDLRLGEITSCLQQAHFLDERLGRESSETLRLATILPEVLLAKI